MQQILILGGTQFCGRLLSESLSRRKDIEVTLFHRGQTHPELFPEFRHVLGDRDTDQIQQISRRDWDAVLDFCAYYPQPLARLAQSLAGRAGRYLLISSVSAYAQDESTSGLALAENHPTLACSRAEASDSSSATYGKRKAACERELLAVQDLPAVIFRPGLIYGPYDYTDRFYYWLWHYARRDAMLQPDRLEQRNQWTYAPDYVNMLEQALLGPLPPSPIYHTLTHEPLSFGEIFASMATACGRQPQIKRVSKAWLDEHDLQFWREIPLFTPYERLYDLSRMHKELAPQLTPFADSVAVSRDYFAQLGWPRPSLGLTPEREEELLAKLG